CGAQIISASWVEFDKPQLVGGGGAICYYKNLDRYTYLNLTVSAPEDPLALGNLVFSDDNGHHEQIFDGSYWANDVFCGITLKPSSTTYTSLWPIYSSNKPSNVWADVWVTVYWGCIVKSRMMKSGFGCTSEKSHLR
ncbi:16003_t:CDS:1, partial [Racocetra persica]